jgi:hypothetical protein
MFIENKYYKWYMAIINRAKSRINASGYTETHHIIPQSFGGSNKKENLVNLSAREHFVCHWLLTKCVSINVDKANYALWLMMNAQNEHQKHRYKINSRTYQILKEKLSKTFSKQQSGRIVSEETKRKISETRKRKIAEGSLRVNENKEKYKLIAEKKKGNKLTDETKKKISKGNKGKVRTEEHKEKLSQINVGKTWSEETKKKLSERLKEDYKSGKRKKVAGMAGKKMSEEAKEKIRQSRIAYWENKRNNNVS